MFKTSINLNLQFINKSFKLILYDSRLIELNDTQKSIIDTFQKVIQSSNIKYLANTLDLEIDKMGNAVENTLHILNEFKNILYFTINIKDIYKCEYCNYTTEELKHRSFINIIQNRASFNIK